MEKALVLTVFGLTLLRSAHSLYINTTPARCSNVCESDHARDPARLRYGKYCGVGYTGCAGAPPCDGLDSCCQQHDNCVGSDDLANYVNPVCSNALLDCVENWRITNAPQFSGSTCDRDDVADTISTVMRLITLDGGVDGDTATTATAILSPVALLADVFFIHFFMYRY